MKTLRDFGIDEASLDDTVHPDTLDETVRAIVKYESEARVFVMGSGQLIFEPGTAPVFWSAQEPNLDELMRGEVEGWEPNEYTTTEQL